MTLQKIEVEDLLQFKYPSNLQYNPDGTILAFVVAYADEKENTYHRDVWISKDGKVKQLTASLDASIVGWKDNEILIINRKGEDETLTTLYEINIHGGEAKPFLSFPFPVSSLKFVKDTIVLTGKIDANDPDAYKDTEDVRKKKLEEKKLEEDYHVVDEVPYWFNGQGYINKVRNALFLYKDGVLKRISSKYQNVHEVVIIKDQVYYTSETYRLRQDRKNQLYVYDLKTNKNTTLYGKKDLSITNLFQLKDELYAQVTDMKMYGLNETGHIMKVQKGKFIECVDPERSLNDGVASDTTLGSGKQNATRDSYWYTLATNEDHVEVWKYDVNFKKKVLFDKPGLITCMDVGKEKLAIVYQSPTALCEVVEVSLDGKKSKQITNSNKDVLKGKYIAKPQPIHYRSTEEDLTGWVLLPENFNPKKKYPAVLDVHGGPRAIYSQAYFHEMQVWVAKGFVVFFTNIRGSDGRGDEFADIRGLYGSVDFENLMDFTDAVLKKYPNIDPKKLCETGGSYGGFMTNWIIGHTDRFCCAASQRSIANWISKLFISDIGLWFNSDQQGAQNVYQDSDILWDHSPLKYAEKVKTPTLFIHSEEDYRCPLPEGMQMMQALAYRNIETRLVIFKGENHELSRGGKPIHRLRRLNEITNWFIKHTK